MVLLPLLYPEVLQRFGVTQPRGVLFYGPPGTGKTTVILQILNFLFQKELYGLMLFIRMK